MTKYEWIPANSETGKSGECWQLFSDTKSSIRYCGTVYKDYCGTFGSFGGETNLIDLKHKTFKEAANRILSEAKEKGRKA